jgi:hypothetical protein
MWYNIVMKMTRKSSTKQKKSELRGFKLGRAQFAKISAVEGVHLSDGMIRDFEEFDQDGLSAEERRLAIIKGYAKQSV